MVLDLTDQERECLLQLLHARHAELLHELHHTDTHEYKEMLKQRLQLLEDLTIKIEKQG